MLTFAAPAFLWSLLALPIVVLLHRVRVRRRRRDVAGLFLWRQAKDVGTSRPRFHSSLLLLLQLLAIAGLALALARPQLVLAGPVDRVLVIDASASMLALDGPTEVADPRAGPPRPGAAPGGGLTGRSRMQSALAVAERLAEDAGRVAIVRAGREPRTVLPFTDDLLLVREALEGFQAGDAGADAARALVLARDLAGLPPRDGDAASEPAGGAGAGDAAGPEDAEPAAAGSAGESAPAGPGAASARIHWIGDAPPPSTAGVQVHPVAGTGHNVGITGFEVVAGQAWIRLSSNGPRPVEVPVQLLRGETPVARSALLVPVRGDVSFTMPVGDAPGAVTARIDPPPEDALGVDDVAHAGAPGVRVVLEESFAALERALLAIPDVRTRVGGSARTSAGGADLHVLVGSEARDLPEAPTVLIPPRDAPAVAADVLDWERVDPLLRFADLRALTVALVDLPSAPGHEDADWTTLIRGVPVPADDAQAEDRPADPVPLLQRLDREEGPVWRFAFHPVRGDLTLRPAFPTMVVNLIDEVRGATRVRLGERLPSGATFEGRPAEVALRPGFYALGDRSLHASLLAEEETRLPGAEAFTRDARPGGAGASAAAPDGASSPAAAAGDVDASGTTRAGGLPAARTLVPWLLAAVVLLALLEWWGFVGWRVPWRRRRDAARGGG